MCQEAGKSQFESKGKKRARTHGHDNGEVIVSGEGVWGKMVMEKK